MGAGYAAACKAYGATERGAASYGRAANAGCATGANGAAAGARVAAGADAGADGAAAAVFALAAFAFLIAAAIKAWRDYGLALPGALTKAGAAVFKGNVKAGRAVTGAKRASGVGARVGAAVAT